MKGVKARRDIPGQMFLPFYDRSDGARQQVGGAADRPAGTGRAPGRTGDQGGGDSGKACGGVAPVDDKRML